MAFETAEETMKLLDDLSCAVYANLIVESVELGAGRYVTHPLKISDETCDLKDISIRVSIDLSDVSGQFSQIDISNNCWDHNFSLPARVVLW